MAMGEDEIAGNEIFRLVTGAVPLYLGHFFTGITHGTLVEAEMMGVKLSPISKYRDDEYHLVRLGAEFSSEGRERSIAFARTQVGHGFGFLDMFGAILYLLFGWQLRLVRRNHEICSSLVVRALQAGGLVPELDPALTLPADLAKLFDIRPYRP